MYFYSTETKPSQNNHGRLSAEMCANHLESIVPGMYMPLPDPVVESVSSFFESGRLFGLALTHREQQ